MNGFEHSPQLQRQSAVENPACAIRRVIPPAARTTKPKNPIHEMKRLSTLLAALALGTTAFAADEPAPSAPAVPATPATPATPAAPPAPAAEAEKKPKLTPEESFKALDKGNHGSFSLDEFKASPRGQKDPAKAEERFKKLDTNSDGKVTLEEFKAGQHEKKPK